MIAFLDHRPVFKGHVLVAPARHVDDLLDLPTGAVRRRCWRWPSEWRSRCRRRWAPQGTFVAINNVVSQSVPHLHMHVVPRTKGDGLRGFFWPRTTYAEGEIESTPNSSARRSAAEPTRNRLHRRGRNDHPDLARCRSHRER